MQLNVNIEVNQALEDAFLEHLRDAAAGMMAADQREAEELIAHIERTKAEDWNEEAKAELAMFLLFRAGFQMGCGYTATEWSNK